MRKLWIALFLVVTVSFAVIGYYGFEIYRKAPPIPEKVINERGELLFTGKDIMEGQNAWQTTGGQELGSIWGHGAYVAPDWTADWLHKEAVFILDFMAKEQFGKLYDSLDEANQAALKVKLKNQVRTNTYDPNTKTLTISTLRQKAFEDISDHYTKLFMGDPEFKKLRDHYAMAEKTLKDPRRMEKMNTFLFWASWACVTERPGKSISYTNNWPAEDLVGNTPDKSLHIWTGFSIVMLLIGIGLLGYYYAKNGEEHEENENLPQKDPLLDKKVTPSMKATLKYFWVVVGLFLVQIIMGIITAHYGVEGDGFFGIPLAEFLPYSISRSWHVQIAIFWIATSWLATGLYMAPAVSGYEPKYQKLGVNVLFGALLFLVVGSQAGMWFGVMQKLGYDVNFYFGHQGYEYTDIGRFWQYILTIGLLLWLFLMGRALKPALVKKSSNRNLVVLFFISSVAIALFYMAGLMWGQHSHLSMVEYWRWWVVHLWVEGFFEVFATVVAAFLFVHMGLLNAKQATKASFFSTVIFLAGGIIGTFHHLYFSGTPTMVLGLGASFSALEIVPLVFMGYEAWHNLKISKSTEWIKAYKWPIYYLISVAFWNFLGAGVFGFLINPPIALYYMQGLNTTAVHGHTALFGVYGMLGIGLMLFVIRGLSQRTVWKEKSIKIAFWSLNLGLILMVLLSLLPIGLAQVAASIDKGLWYARSAEFLQQDYLQVLRWLRVVGDVVFTVGVLSLAWFIIGLKTGWSVQEKDLVGAAKEVSKNEQRELV
ncbi:nitric-oxide reductase large subunit [Xanthovirga aplysinae]|uniref:nitric-oxide reductase large subunit n=1 Tax=Xanthovirga aplysinae TaxID=2529853 RepID=UPI0012BC0ECE|nr:nitric-oxide reductase large subunit [Xanthovirga aplysinae]MTI31872.1 nitric-oxide reductase large subunit [Xanthovirga aplysinae]